jgi:CheY-like chemotaxis protein
MVTEKPMGGVEADAPDLDDLLTAIVERAELLVGSLDPSTTSFRYAQEIRGAALSAARRANRAGQPALSGPDIDTTLPDRPLAPSVLVVEDEPGIREFIRIVLLRAGYEVVTVSGPRAALDALRRQPAISLMLVDIVMPEMDGYEVVEEARRIAPSVHVVFVSAFAPDPARQPGGDSFLAKPFTTNSLTDVVKRALSN